MKKILLTTFLAIHVFAAYAQSFTLRGRVVKENNEPMVGMIKVKVTESEQVWTSTDSSGNFEISLPDTMKYYTAVLLATGYMTSEYLIDWNTNNIRIVMIEGGKKGIVRWEYVPTDAIISKTGICGIITDKQTGETIPFANVAIISPKGTVIAEGLTDFEGNYIIRGINPGTHTLKISYIGYQTQKIQGIVVGRGKTMWQPVKLTPTTEISKDIEIIHAKYGTDYGF